MRSSGKVLIGIALLSAVALADPGKPINPNDDMPPEILAILQKGDKATAEDKAKLKAYFTSKLPKTPASAPDMPPELLAIVKKGSGASAAEKQKLQAWIVSKGRTFLDAKRPGGGGGGGGGGFTLADVMPVERPDVHLADRPAPTLAKYKLRAQKYAKAIRTQLDPRDAIKLDDLVRRSPSAARVADLGAKLVMLGTGDARARYVLATAAAQDPTDATTANDLGVTLKDAGDLDGALDCFVWAKANGGDSALLSVNRGWAVLYMGDFATAEKLFLDAIAVDPSVAQSYEGLGMLHRARGDELGAKDWFRKSLAHGFSMVASLGAASSHGSDDPANPPPPNPPLPPDGNIHPGEDSPGGGGQGPGGGGGGPSDSGAGFADAWPIKVGVPTIPTSPDKMAAYASDLASFAKAGGERFEQLSKLAIAERERRAENARDMTPQLGDDGTITYPRLYARSLFYLGDAERRLEQRMDPVKAKFERTYEKWRTETAAEMGDEEKKFAAKVKSCSNNACLKSETAQSCNRRHTIGVAAHGAMSNAWGPYASTLDSSLKDYVSETVPYLHGLSDPALNHWQNLERLTEVTKYLVDERVALAQWAMVITPVSNGRCDEPTQVPSGAPPDDTSSPPPKKPCPLPPGGSVGGNFMGFGISLSCDKISVSVGELVGGSLTHTFSNGGKPAEDEIWVGLKLATGAGVDLGIASAKVGAQIQGGTYIKVVNNTITEAGYSGGASAGASATSGPATAGGAASANVRINLLGSAASGMTTSVGAGTSSKLTVF